MNLLEQLKKVTDVVADTGDFVRMHEYAPKDATTNPSLILKASLQSEYQELISKVKKDHPGVTHDELVDHLLVAFGCEILKIVPGRVSTEIDAKLSFDIEETVMRGRHLIDLYKAKGIDTNRVLIKIASTWEGIQSARILQNEGINCNLTLLFNLPQAIACADAKVKLISPFIGRITDWYKKSAGEFWNETQNSGLLDPGVKSVTGIYNYFKYFDIKTEIMGASFRNIEQIKALAGCDLLTISPELLEILKNTESELTTQLNSLQAKNLSFEKISLDEKQFRKAMNIDPMASEKLSEGIRNFSVDTDKLITFLSQ
ncbi:MAG: transaldolase [Betaproteobacteria bacterium]|jgi:transaldolase